MWNGTDSPNQHTSRSRAASPHTEASSRRTDLCLYWSILQAPTWIEPKDFFWSANNTFDPYDTGVSNQSATLIYYLHGGLHLWTDGVNDGKWTSAAGKLLDLKSKYRPESSRRPLFVSEGDSRAKMRAIQRSTYLSHCLEMLRADDANTVLFGQGLAAQDEHIAEALNTGTSRKVAISVYPSRDAKAVVAEKGRIQKVLSNHTVLFFDSTTHPLGDPKLRIKP